MKKSKLLKKIRSLQQENLEFADDINTITKQLTFQGQKLEELNKLVNKIDPKSDNIIILETIDYRIKQLEENMTGLIEQKIEQIKSENNMMNTHFNTRLNKLEK